MDRNRFDALARLLATSGSRRITLGALLGVLVGPAAEAVARKRGAGQDGGKDRDRGQDRDKDREDRQSDPRLQAEHRGKGGKRRKHKKKRRGGSGGGQNPPPPPDCCGIESCAPPEPGSTRSNCDFAGRSFVGQDHHGSTFRGIDGRETNFNQTDNQGSVFAAACLQGARFRRASLEGSTWSDACLFDADFAGADLGGDSAVFDGGLFCNTVMPDGAVNDRDCGRATTCCRQSAEPGPACQTAGDCAGQPCQTRTCQNGQCVYDEVVTGPSPNALCTFCCQNTCCLAPANQCNTAGACCAPNCEGRVCGPDGCGGAGTCGTCPDGEACDANGQCLCDGQSCANGCCDSGGRCQPGSTDGACGSDGGTCAQCTAQEECVGGECVTVACTGNCSQDADCPNFRNCVCNQAQGQCCTRACAGKVCGPDGCGGRCGDGCPDGTVCSADGTACLCTAQTCPNGCCANGPGQAGTCQLGNTAQACGTGGARCVSCGAGLSCRNAQCVCVPDCTGKDCGSDGCGGTCGSCSTGQVCVEGECICSAQTCPNGCCTNGPGQPGTCRPGISIQSCGTGGEECATCDDDDEVCQGGQCVECDDICPCTGQTFCALADSAICFQRPPTRPGDEQPACFCLVSLAGQPVCIGELQNPPTNCQSDTDCQGFASDAVCVPAAPGSQACPTNSNFCAAPCCTPQSCPNGCCDGITGCLPGNEFGFCGTGGELCFQCAPDQVCQNGQCVEFNCEPNCTCGTMDVRDFCQAGGPNVECGGGIPDPCFCTASLTDQPICAGVFQNPPSNCTSDAACQVFAPGAVCVPAAPAGSECPTAGNFCASPCCTPQSCPNGCCFSGICVPGNTTEACGVSGDLCIACTNPCTRCENGACQPLFVNGDPCTNDSQCCSDNCVNGFCAEGATQ